MDAPNLQLSVEFIDPDFAREALSVNVAKNRKVRPKRVDLYAAQILAGEFMLTGETIVFDEAGRLVNGQHRLHACLKTDMGFWCVVVRGVSANAYDYLDGGLPRKADDVLRQHGIGSYATVAAAAKLVIGYETGTIANTTNLNLVATRQAILREATEHDAVYQRFAKYISPSRSIRLNPSAALAFGVLASRRAGVERVEAWLAGMCEGADLPAGDSRIAMTRWCVSATRVTNTETLAALIRAWNRQYTNEQSKSIKGWYGGTPFPVIDDREQVK